MLNKCINCCKWITCKDSSNSKNNCEDFKFKRLNYIKSKGEINNEKKRKNYKENNKTTM